MKTQDLLACLQHRTWIISQLAAVLFISASSGHAQDASCKAVADAQLLLARTPHHAFSTDVHGGRSIASESISAQGGLFWATDGVWHKSARSTQEFARQTGDSVRELRDCHRIGDESINGQPATKFAFHNHANGGDESVWIAKGSGLVLRSEALIEDRHISSQYEYTNVQAPPHAH